LSVDVIRNQRLTDPEESSTQGDASVSSRFQRTGLIEALSSCFGFVDDHGVDGFGKSPGAPGSAAEFAEDAPGLELGVGAFAG
jgi:hypothetical protein